MPYEPSDPRSCPLPTYPSYVGGRDIDADRHVYTVTTTSILQDVFRSLTLKRHLEQGRADPAQAADFVVGRCAVASESVVQTAVEAAAGAFPAWSAVPLERRMQLGAGIRERIRRGHAAFVDVLVSEGQPRALAEWQVCGLLDVYATESLDWCAAQMHQQTRLRGRIMTLRRNPDGVVCVNPPQNTPAASTMFAVSALMAGNTVVVRAPRSAPLGVMHALREFVVPVLEELGAPAGTLNAYCARPGPTLQSWLESPHVADIFYTGGVERGLELERECVAHGKKPVLELAGNDCVVVWRDADVELAAQALSECFFGSGQICMVPNQVIAHPAIADELIVHLSKQAAGIRPGPPDRRDVLLTPVLRGERFFAYLRDAVAKGARVEFGGRRLEVDGSPSDTGMFLEPTVLRIHGCAGARDIEAVREETFFPLLPVVVPDPADDRSLLEEAIAYVTSNPYGLRNSLWATDPAVIERFVARTFNGGLLKVNDSHVSLLPWLPSHGGTGYTGGVFGEANYPMLRCSRLQGVSIATGISPRDVVLGAYSARFSAP